MRFMSSAVCALLSQVQSRDSNLLFSNQSVDAALLPPYDLLYEICGSSSTEVIDFDNQLASTAESTTNAPDNEFSAPKTK